MLPCLLGLIPGLIGRVQCLGQKPLAGQNEGDREGESDTLDKNRAGFRGIRQRYQRHPVLVKGDTKSSKSEQTLSGRGDTGPGADQDAADRDENQQEHPTAARQPTRVQGQHGKTIDDDKDRQGSHFVAQPAREIEGQNDQIGDQVVDGRKVELPALTASAKVYATPARPRMRITLSRRSIARRRCWRSQAIQSCILSLLVPVLGSVCIGRLGRVATPIIFKQRWLV